MKLLSSSHILKETVERSNFLKSFSRLVDFTKNNYFHAIKTTINKDEAHYSIRLRVISPFDEKTKKEWARFFIQATSADVLETLSIDLEEIKGGAVVVKKDSLKSNFA